MTVKNIKGSGDRACKCGSWLQHWRNFSNQSVSTCSALDCSKKATDGAHVKEAHGDDHRQYIVPFCHAHNLSSEPITIDDSTKLVPANVSLTCN